MYQTVSRALFLICRARPLCRRSRSSYTGARRHGAMSQLCCSNVVAPSAAKHGRLECLKHAHKNGCPWDKDTCECAAENGHIECLKYAHENGCPYPNELLSVVVKQILFPKWRMAVKARVSRPYAYHWMEDTARTLCAEGGKGRKCDYAAFTTYCNEAFPTSGRV